MRTFDYRNCLPYTVNFNPNECELFAQGRDRERKARLKATQVFENDFLRYADDLDKIMELSKTNWIPVYQRAQMCKKLGFIDFFMIKKKDNL